MGDRRLNTKVFIARSKSIHNNRYNYSKSKYILGKNKICIICPIHGEFFQIAKSHLNGHGCFNMWLIEALYPRIFD